MRLNTFLKVNCLASLLLFSLPGFSEVEHTTTSVDQKTVTTTDNKAHKTNHKHGTKDNKAHKTETDGKHVDADRKARTPAEDAVITKTVKKLVTKSKMLSPLDVTVVTNKGVVEFSGLVDSDSEVTALVELAESVVGVEDVDSSKLNVKSGTQPVKDALTTAKIKGLLIREDLFGNKDVDVMGTSVETKEGVVYIIGSVAHTEQLKNAVDIIKHHVPEVKKIEFSVTKVTPTDKADNS